MRLPDQTVLIGCLNPVGSSPCFLLPLFRAKDVAFSNHIFVQKIGYKDEVVGFEEFDAGSAFIKYLPGPQLELSIGSPAIWAFETSESKVFYGSGDDFYSLLLAELGTVQDPFIRLQIARFCGLENLHEFESKAYRILKRVSADKGVAWRDTEVFLPTVRRIIHAHHPKITMAELHAVSVNMRDGSMNIVLPQSLYKNGLGRKVRVNLSAAIAPYSKEFGIKQWNYTLGVRNIDTPVYWEAAGKKQQILFLALDSLKGMVSSLIQNPDEADAVAPKVWNDLCGKSLKISSPDELFYAPMSSELLLKRLGGMRPNDVRGQGGVVVLAFDYSDGCDAVTEVASFLTAAGCIVIGVLTRTALEDASANWIEEYAMNGGVFSGLLISTYKHSSSRTSFLKPALGGFVRMLATLSRDNAMFTFFIDQVCQKRPAGFLSASSFIDDSPQYAIISALTGDELSEFSKRKRQTLFAHVETSSRVSTTDIQNALSEEFGKELTMFTHAVNPRLRTRVEVITVDITRFSIKSGARHNRQCVDALMRNGWRVSAGTPFSADYFAQQNGVTVDIYCAKSEKNVSSLDITGVARKNRHSPFPIIYMLPARPSPTLRRKARVENVLLVGLDEDEGTLGSLLEAIFEMTIARLKDANQIELDRGMRPRIMEALRDDLKKRIRSDYGPGFFDPGLTVRITRTRKTESGMSFEGECFRKRTGSKTLPLDFKAGFTASFTRDGIKFDKFDSLSGVLSSMRPSIDIPN